MLIKRTVYFSQVDQETGEEKLFSVKEKDFAQAEEEKKNTGKKVGKAVIDPTVTDDEVREAIKEITWTEDFE